MKKKNEVGTDSNKTVTADGIQFILGNEKIEMQTDGRPWAEGFKQDSGTQGIIEYVLPGEKVENWSELVTLNFFRGPGKPGVPEKFAGFTQKNLQDLCREFQWKDISRDTRSITYGWDAKGCPGQPDQSEVARVIQGEQGLYILHYASKTVPLPEETKSAWIQRLQNAKVSTPSDTGDLREKEGEATLSKRLQNVNSSPEMEIQATLISHLDGRSWKVGYRYPGEDKGQIEYILQNETVKNWSENFADEFINSPEVTPAKFVASSMSVLREQCRVAYQNILEEGEREILHEFQVSNCGGASGGTYTVLERVIKTTRGVRAYRYNVIKSSIPEEKRSTWIKILKSLPLSGNLPNEGTAPEKIKVGQHRKFVLKTGQAAEGEVTEEWPSYYVVKDPTGTLKVILKASIETSEVSKTEGMEATSR